LATAQGALVILDSRFIGVHIVQRHSEVMLRDFSWQQNSATYALRLALTSTQPTDFPAGLNVLVDRT
jgi:hypothetical protein